MSIPYESNGRTNQKQRTRRALIEAARSLMADGSTPTVEEAAELAAVSRTTAYRYFPSRHDLLAASFPIFEQGSLLGEDPPADPEERLDLVITRSLQFTVVNEPALRAALRLSLEPGNSGNERPVLRRGRVIVWLEDALAPLRGQLSDSDFDRLVRAIRAAAGIESLIWLVDVAGLSRDEAQDLMRWSARSLLRAALSENSTTCER